MFVYKLGAILVSLETRKIACCVLWYGDGAVGGQGFREILRTSIEGIQIIKMTTEDAKAYLSRRQIPQLFEVSRLAVNDNIVNDVYLCQSPSAGPRGMSPHHSVCVPAGVDQHPSRHYRIMTRVMSCSPRNCHIDMSQNVTKIPRSIESVYRILIILYFSL